MFKIIRNTIFTLVVVSLTALGLHWNTLVAKEHSMVDLGQTVVASQTFGTVSPDFSLKISPNAPQIHLGQTQTVTISTIANAQLNIVTQYPDGSINHPSSLKAQANKEGIYSFDIPVNDFHYVGIFRISVVASAGTKTTEAIAEFKVTSWQPSDNSTGGYAYPLVP